jgi:hypothetical protein
MNNAHSMFPRLAKFILKKHSDDTELCTSVMKYAKFLSFTQKDLDEAVELTEEETKKENLDKILEWCFLFVALQFGYSTPDEGIKVMKGICYTIYPLLLDVVSYSDK